ncbi:MAG TPA: TolC family protein [Sediminispirochaeta sp.]|nr:TolC family protein [Sediminispirochaeta sp.]
MAGRYHYWTVLFLLVPVFAAALPDSHQERRRIPLHTAFASAYSEDLRAQQLRSQLDLLRQSVDPHFSSRLPRIGFSYQGQETYGLFSPYRLQHQISTTLNWRLLNGGRAAEEKRRFLIETQQFELELHRRGMTLWRQVLETSLSILLEKEQIQQLQQTLESQELSLMTGRTLKQAKAIVESELRELELRYWEVEAQLQEHRLQLRHHERKFSRLVSPAESESFVPVLSFRSTIVPAPSPILSRGRDFFLQHALESSPEITAASLELRLAELDSRSDSLIPTVELHGTYSLSGESFPPKNPSFSLALRISTADPFWKIDAGDGRDISDRSHQRNPSLGLNLDPRMLFSDQKKISSLNLAQMRLKRERLEKQLRYRVEELLDSLELLERSFPLARRRIELYEELSDFKAASHRRGEITRKELFEARIEVLEARRRFFELCTNTLLREIEILELCGLERLIPLSARRFLTPHINFHILGDKK